tara:strand:- start:171 stop:425 length:255 start_codon:yes stop_codon:yes gene_type:complete
MSDIDYEDYFFTKYSSDVTDLFMNIKNISNSYCVNIFNNKNQVQNGCNNLQEFLFDNIIFTDEINDEENEYEKEIEEIYNEENI